MGDWESWLRSMIRTIHTKHQVWPMWLRWSNGCYNNGISSIKYMYTFWYQVQRKLICFFYYSSQYRCTNNIINTTIAIALLISTRVINSSHQWIVKCMHPSVLTSFSEKPQEAAWRFFPVTTSCVCKARYLAACLTTISIDIRIPHYSITPLQVPGAHTNFTLQHSSVELWP